MLILIKVDSEIGKTIAIANTTFKILNTDTNQYCFSICWWKSL